MLLILKSFQNRAVEENEGGYAQRRRNYPLRELSLHPRFWYESNAVNPVVIEPRCCFWTDTAVPVDKVTQVANADAVISGNGGMRCVIAKAFQVLPKCLFAANWLQWGFHISMVAQVEKPVNSFH